MIVCVCNAISDTEIRDWVDRGGRSLEQLQADMGLGTCCGACCDCACEVISETVAERTSGPAADATDQPARQTQ